MKREWCCLLLLAYLLPGFLLSAETNVTGLAADTPGPLVVMKQAQIAGRVFVFTDEGEGGSLGASRLEIVVRDPDRQGKILEVETTEDGAFVLPDLDVGNYQLDVGRLNVRLRVEDPEVLGEKRMYAAKVLVVFIPEEMAH